MNWDIKSRFSFFNVNFKIWTCPDFHFSITRLLGLWILSLCKDLSERMGGAEWVELGAGQRDGVLCIVRGITRHVVFLTLLHSLLSG